MTRLQVLLLTGRAESARLARSPLVLVGLVVSAVLIWWNTPSQVPLWWAADIGIGSGMLAVAGAALIAAQLAAGRARRDRMTELYASYPSSPAVRTGGHLLGVAGPVALAALLTGGAVIWLDSRGAVGSPRPAVLAGCVLLVVLAGATGVALGSWLPHPMAGILAAVVLGVVELGLVLTFAAWVRLPDGAGWLFPWYQPGYVLSTLPGISVPLPPAAHVAELAGLTALAAVAALWRRLRRHRIAAVVAVACLAVTGWSGWSQTRPVPVAELSALVDQVTHPAQFEQCAVQRGVSYCFYPAFRPLVGSWATAVDGVLARLPSRPAKKLVVRQVVDEVNGDFLSPPLAALPYLRSRDTARNRQIRRLYAELLDFPAADPGLIPGSSAPPVYVDLDWGAGSALGASQLGLALSTAFSVTGLPTTAPTRTFSFPDGSGGTFSVFCLPVGQAREAISLWLAASATPAARVAFAAGSVSYAGATRVGRRWLATYDQTGSGPAMNLETTAQGTLLARAMVRLPARRVESALAARWPGWLSPGATDAQLAAALGIPLPRPPAPARELMQPDQPPSPVCR